MKIMVTIMTTFVTIHNTITNCYKETHTYTYKHTHTNKHVHTHTCKAEKERPAWKPASKLTLVKMKDKRKGVYSQRRQGEPERVSHPSPMSQDRVKGAAEPRVPQQPDEG